jgi:hypothetical protein
MSARAALMLAAAGVTLAACGTSPRDAVRAKVQQFAQTASHHDYKTMCTQVLAPSLAARAGSAGLSCEQAMAIALGSVRNPTISVGQVTVKGDAASAIVLSVAANQQASLDTLDLVRTHSGWRITALKGPPGSRGSG